MIQYSRTHFLHMHVIHLQKLCAGSCVDIDNGTISSHTHTHTHTHTSLQIGKAILFLIIDLIYTTGQTGMPEIGYQLLHVYCNANVYLLQQITISVQSNDLHINYCVLSVAFLFS